MKKQIDISGYSMIIDTKEAVFLCSEDVITIHNPKDEESFMVPISEVFRVLRTLTIGGVHCENGVKSKIK